jgi:uncharacterized membrane protein
MTILQAFYQVMWCILVALPFLLPAAGIVWGFCIIIEGITRPGLVRIMLGCALVAIMLIAMTTLIHWSTSCGIDFTSYSTWKETTTLGVR